MRKGSVEVEYSSVVPSVPHRVETNQHIVEYGELDEFSLARVREHEQCFLEAASVLLSSVAREVGNDAKVKGVSAVTGIVEVAFASLARKTGKAVKVGRALALFIFGSRVYGTATASSDYDVNLVVDMAPPPSYIPDARAKSYMSFKGEVVNVTLLPLPFFVLMVREHRHEALECLHLPEQYCWLQRVKVPFELDKDVLRRTVHWESLQRFRIARKKYRQTYIPLATRARIAKKEVVHSFRYLMFATQIIKHGKILDYGAANEDYHKLMALPDEGLDWDLLGERRKFLVGEFNTSKPDDFVFSSHHSREATVIRMLRWLHETEQEEKRKDRKCKSKSLGSTSASPSKRRLKISYIHDLKAIKEQLKVMEKEEETPETTQDVKGGKITIDAEGVTAEARVAQDHPLAPVALLKYAQIMSDTKSKYAGLAELFAVCGDTVIATKHSKYPNLIHLQYTRIKPIKGEARRIVASVCNCLIVNQESNWDVVCFGTEKPVSYIFQREGEPVVPKHLEEALSPFIKPTILEPDRVQLKEGTSVHTLYDGTRVCLYWFKGEWHICSEFESDDPQAPLGWQQPHDGRDVSDKPKKKGGRKKTESRGKKSARGEQDCALHGSVPLAHLFWGLWKELRYRFPDEEMQDTASGVSAPACVSIATPEDVRHISFCFEMINKSHKYLTAGHDIVLVSAWDSRSHKHVDPVWLANMCGYSKPAVHEEFRALDDVVNVAKKANPFRLRGFVVCSGDYSQRLEVQCTQYSAASLTTDRPLNLCANLHLSKANLFQLVRTSSAKRLLVHHFPEWADDTQLTQMQSIFEGLIEQMEQALLALDPVKHDRATFARGLREYGWLDAILMKIRNEYFDCPYSFFVLNALNLVEVALKRSPPKVRSLTQG